MPIYCVGMDTYFRNITAQRLLVRRWLEIRFYSRIASSSGPLVFPQPRDFSCISFTYRLTICITGFTVQGSLVAVWRESRRVSWLTTLPTRAVEARARSTARAVVCELTLAKMVSNAVFLGV
jgi:hypothetical protein